MTDQHSRGALPLGEALAEMKRSVEHATSLYFEEREENRRMREALRVHYEAKGRALDDYGDQHDVALWDAVQAADIRPPRRSGGASDG